LTNIDNNNELEFLNHLDEAALFQKSARHFIDALEERRIRSDIDYHGKGIFMLTYNLQQSYFFQFLMKVSSVVYILLVFIEPSQLYDKQLILEQNDNLTLAFWIELVIIVLFSFNFIFEFILMIGMFKYARAIVFRTKGACYNFSKFLFYDNLYSTFSICLDLYFLIDFIVYATCFPYHSFRFTRILRPGRHRFISEADDALCQTHEISSRIHIYYS